MNKIDIVKALIADEVSNSESGKPFPAKVGDKVFLRTVTLYYLGRVKEITSEYVVLEESSWVQDTGVRLTDFIEKGIFGGQKEVKAEIEPIGTHAVFRAGMIDCVGWKHDLPDQQY